MIHKIRYLSFLFFLVISLIGCQAAGSPGDAVEGYLQAVIQSDEVQAISLSCAEWEQDAKMEAASFEAVEAKLEGVSCSVKEEKEDYQVVECTGVILATYGAEDQALELEGRLYRVVLEGGEWRMCGYQ